jgi:hypothetical protein
LPDFSWYNKLKWGKIYQKAVRSNPARVLGGSLKKKTCVYKPVFAEAKTKSGLPDGIF